MLGSTRFTPMQCKLGANNSQIAHCKGLLSCPACPGKQLKHQQHAVGLPKLGPRARCLARGSDTEPLAVDIRVASVSVDISGVVEQVQVKLTQPDSRLVQVEMKFPLGLVLENVDGEVVIAQLEADGAAAAAGCKLGDVLRATTAMTMQMTYPTMNLMFGGVGRPKLAKVLLPTTKIPFAKVMDAVRSNSIPVGGDGRIALVMERAGKADGLPDQGCQQQEKVPVTVGAVMASGGSQQDDGAAQGMFDPKIFE